MVEMEISQSFGRELEFEFKEQEESEFQTVTLKQKYGFDLFFEGIPLKTIENTRKVTYHLYRTRDRYILLWEVRDSYFGDVERNYTFFENEESLIQFVKRSPDEPHDRLLLLQLVKSLGTKAIVPL